MTCKNCGHSFEGNFCNNCGQKFNVRRINFNYLIDEISNSFFQVNRGIFFTIKDLAIRPGNSIRDFLNGKRKQHFKPLAFILMVSAIYVLTTYFTGKKTYLGDAMSGMSSAFSDNGDELAITNIILNWLSNNFAYSTLLLLPIFSFASYLSFIKVKYNYFEHLILNFYIAGQQIIIYLTFDILFFTFKIEGYLIQIVPFIIAMLYLFWAFIQFFKTEKLLLKIVLTILNYILYFIIISITITLISILEMMIKR